jgi:hypothetical protein
MRFVLGSVFFCAKLIMFCARKGYWRFKRQCVNPGSIGKI